MLKQLFAVLLLVVVQIPKSASDQATIFDFFHQFSSHTFNHRNNSTVLTRSCGNALRRVQNGIISGDRDALKMADATAKLSSGLLSGNINQYGDFDECLEVQNAKYCLAELNISHIQMKSYVNNRNLIHSYYAFQETFQDPGHRVPGFTMLRWGFCIPKDCSGQDLQNSLVENFGIKSRIRNGMCQMQKSEKPESLHFGDYLARSFFLFILVATMMGTYMDVKGVNIINNETFHRKLLTSFSLRKNWKTLIHIDKENRNEIHGVHGIRALSALALLMSHKSMALLYNPYINRTGMIRILGESWSIIGKNAILYTDCFILISGLLTGTSLLNSTLKNQSMQFGEKIISRLFRITPNIFAIILFCTYILPSMGSGPLWPVVINHHSDLCKKYMWRNFFYVHNYFGFENMCLTHTHQVGIDMQLFLIAPILIYTYCKSKKMGISLMIAIIIASTGLRFWVTWYQHLTSIVYFGIPISKMFTTADHSYILPTHRITVYTFGILLACLMKYTGPYPQYANLNHVKLKRIYWVCFSTLMLLTWFGPMHMARIGYIYNRNEATWLAAFSPIFWGSSIAFLLYAIRQNAVSSTFRHFLCWRYYQVCTKISYALYLVQFPVFFYNVGLTRHVDQFKVHFLLPPGETFIILFLSVILTLLVEMPFLNIKNVIISKDDDRSENAKISADNGLRAIDRKAKSG